MITEDNNRIETLVREKLGGKSYTTIRSELEDSGMSDGDIKELIRQVDELVLGEAVKKVSQDRAQQWYRSGMVLAVIGLILSIAYNAGIILKNFPALLIYSPFIAGILVMFYGRFLQRRQSTPTDSGTGAIRSRRPYK